MKSEENHMQNEEKLQTTELHQLCLYNYMTSAFKLSADPKSAFGTSQCTKQKHQVTLFNYAISTAEVVQ